MASRMGNLPESESVLRPAETASTTGTPVKPQPVVKTSAVASSVSTATASADAGTGEKPTAKPKRLNVPRDIFAPKRPLSAYMIFVRDSNAEKKAANASLSATKTKTDSSSTSALLTDATSAGTSSPAAMAMRTRSMAAATAAAASMSSPAAVDFVKIPVKESMPAMAKRLGAEWRALTAAKRQPFDAKAQLEKERFALEFADYAKSDLFKLYNRRVAMLRLRHALESGGTVKVQLPKDVWAPKKPGSAYNEYLRSLRSGETEIAVTQRTDDIKMIDDSVVTEVDSSKGTEVEVVAKTTVSSSADVSSSSGVKVVLKKKKKHLSRAGAGWKALSKEEKEPYAEAQRKRLEEWKTKMEAHKRSEEYKAYCALLEEWRAAKRTIEKQLGLQQPSDGSSEEEEEDSSENSSSDFEDNTDIGDIDSEELNQKSEEELRDIMLKAHSSDLKSGGKKKKKKKAIGKRTVKVKRRRKQRKSAKRENGGDDSDIEEVTMKHTDSSVGNDAKVGSDLDVEMRDEAKSSFVRHWENESDSETDTEKRKPTAKRKSADVKSRKRSGAADGGRVSFQKSRRSEDGGRNTAADSDSDDDESSSSSYSSSSSSSTSCDCSSCLRKFCSDESESSSSYSSSSSEA